MKWIDARFNEGSDSEIDEEMWIIDDNAVDAAVPLPGGIHLEHFGNPLHPVRMRASTCSQRARAHTHTHTCPHVIVCATRN